MTGVYQAPGSRGRSMVGVGRPAASSGWASHPRAGQGSERV